MKSSSTRHLLLFAALLASPSLLRADDITVNNLTIQQSAFFGSVFTDTAATISAEGLRIDTAQTVAEVYHSSTIPGHYVQDNWVTVEDWGWVTYGHWETPSQVWNEIGSEWIPPVVDEYENVVTPGYWQPVFGWVPTGPPYFVTDGSSWGVIGTHQENQGEWVPSQTNSWTETVAGVPRVRFNATRSDTNFVFRVPGNGPEGMKDVFVVWEGGVSVPSADPSRMTVLQADAIQHTLAEAAGSTTTRTTAEAMTQTANVAYTEGESTHNDTSESELRPALLKFTRTENVDGSTTVAQTQIAAKSASFAGVVDVNGNLKVKGAVLIAPQGDLLMGPYTNGPQP